MKDLYILGAGGMGRELMSYVQFINFEQGPRWEIKGFLDDTEDPLRSKACDFGVVGKIVDYMPRPNETLIMGVSSPAGKRKIASLLKPRGATFDTMQHPSAYMGWHNEIGEGNVFYGHFGMTVNCRVGNFCSLLSSGIGHDVVIGDFTTISSNCNIMGRVKIGQGVFIGGNVGVAPGVTIGDGAFVCLGSMVFKDVPPGAKVLGNPARVIGQLDGWV